MYKVVPPFIVAVGGKERKKGIQIYSSPELDRNQYRKLSWGKWPNF
jgi:hypothetical protein